MSKVLLNHLHKEYLYLSITVETVTYGNATAFSYNERKQSMKFCNTPWFEIAWGALMLTPGV